LADLPLPPLLQPSDSLYAALLILDLPLVELIEDVQVVLVSLEGG